MVNFSACEMLFSFIHLQFVLQDETTSRCLQIFDLCNCRQKVLRFLENYFKWLDKKLIHTIIARSKLLSSFEISKVK